MNAAVDPFRGKTYSQILAGLSREDLRKYTDRPHPITSRMPVGVTMWDTTIGRHVTV